jgi:hypothetical protein
MLVTGDMVLITEAKTPMVHPWSGHIGELIEFTTYGLGWKGWKVKLQNGQECFANAACLKRIGK